MTFDLQTCAELLTHPQTEAVPGAELRPRIAVIGGGVAGSTVALRLAQQGELDVVLMEQGPSLVNGPPMCHLHAGGNLYREISDAQCLKLLKQSIDTLKLYPHVANVRPTVIAVPTRDAGDPLALLPRLEKVRAAYHALVQQDPDNARLGAPEEYFRLFERAELEALREAPLPQQPERPEHWMIPLAKTLDFDTVQWPLVLVQEYGLSLFRLAASAELSLASFPQVEVMCGTRLLNVEANGAGWDLHYQQGGVSRTMTVDYLVNACGYRTGTLDDVLGEPRQRLVEFKAAYLARWPEAAGTWPEVIFHGERGTPEGMAQLTPYGDGLFQLHGMTESITLFKSGLVASDDRSAQPRLAPELEAKIVRGWPESVVVQRSRAAIAHMSHFLPGFASAEPGGKPLFGAQQIPGTDPSLRAADVSFGRHRYARTEIVKASSALSAANAIIDSLAEQGWLQGDERPVPMLERDAVVNRAVELAEARHYPPQLARPSGMK
ncbi:FAD dependent oxidoreductase [Ferrimonas balearica DSM 9799]|uniref:FAD dependent oxidoreductase n=1 Tax=Ferrimonas balearica (strain DSM 9799 / CCM 4581 / KCTC 23876 / PAT) TaxID=550540 RepID=E1SPW2_FERBD|nr:FAD-dependent oxidoreductase [Ferrimonas balearica]ADN75757.1 FAD dependent oxidoreductase [Ferrimonas balearica DSM 9799]